VKYKTFGIFEGARLEHFHIVVFFSATLESKVSAPLNLLFPLFSRLRFSGKEARLKELCLPSQERLDSRGGFVWEQTLSCEAFVSLLFVEVELSKKRRLSLIVLKAISGIWKTVSIVHFFCVHCSGFLFTRFFFSSPLFSERSSWPSEWRSM